MKLETVLAVLVAILAFQTALNFWIWLKIPGWSPESLPRTAISPEIPEGWVRARVELQPDGVLLVSDCKALPISISEEQLYSIQRGLYHQTGFRPLTHDMVRDILEFFGIQVLAARVDRLENQTFYGRLVLRQGDKKLSLDVRPSDAIALAVRLGLPVLVKSELLETYGEDIC